MSRLNLEQRIIEFFKAQNEKTKIRLFENLLFQTSSDILEQMENAEIITPSTRIS